MLVLAIDTALDACAAAILDTQAGAVVASETQTMRRGHAEAIMPIVGRVMGDGGVEFADLDRIAVTVGPGSFTGLRVGIAAARGIALAARRPAVGLSTFAAYAAPYFAGGQSRTVAVAIDARHDHCYLQIFAADGSTLVTPQFASVDEVARAAGKGSVLVVGSAAALVGAAWPTGWPPPTIEAQDAPNITWVAHLGAAAEPGRAPPKPFYLRRPDARDQAGARLPRR